MTIPISYSETINFRFQHALFTQLEKITKKTEWIRVPSLLASGTCSLAYLITRTSSIAELALHSSALFLSSETGSENRTHAEAMMKRIPSQFIDLFALPPALVFDVGCIISDPKSYVDFRVSTIRVIINHLEAGTLYTKEYSRDCNEISGRFK